MSSTSQPTTHQDLYTDLMNRVRVDTSNAPTIEQAKRYINIALSDMHINFGEKFPWAERHAVLQTMAPYNTGTIAITKGSTTLTGTSTLWNTAHSFGANNVRTTSKIAINGTVNVYTISAIGSDTSITLNERYQDTTETAGTYTSFEDEYALASDFLRPFDIQYFDTNSSIPLVGRLEFRRLHPRNKTPGKIVMATIVDRGFSGSTTPVRRIIFYQPPNDFKLVPYNYITSNLAVTSAGVAQTGLSADADEPIVPLHYRHVIVFGALYHWYRDKKNDSRSQEVKAEYVGLVARIASDTEIGASRPRLTPNVSHYRSSARRPFSRGSSRYTTGTAFDENR